MTDERNTDYYGIFPRIDEEKFQDERDFDLMIEDILPELPPEDIVYEVNPWRKAVQRILTGFALSTLKLNFFLLQYILPAAGMILMLLGFRALRQENRGFRVCWVLSVIHTVYGTAVYILNGFVFGSTIFETPLMRVLMYAGTAVMLILFIAFRQGMKASREKAGLSGGVKSASAMILWYVVLCALALVRFSGLLIPILLIIVYILILRNLFHMAGDIEEAGYSVQPSPVRISDQTLACGVAAILAAGLCVGYLFFSSYPMEWTENTSIRSEEAKKIEAHLAELGFPKEILADLTEEDLMECEGALQVIVSQDDYAVNDGRGVQTVKGTTIYRETVYDVKELRLTGVSVLLPEERETWKIIHHFEWREDPGYRGTEAIQIWPAGRDFQGWMADDEYSGRVLYDEGGKTYVSPYYSLDTVSFVSSGFFGSETRSDPFAEFSFPDRGQRHRGYISYSIREMQDGYIIDSWINYVYQRNWLQYPVRTASEHRRTSTASRKGCFRVIQDAQQFFPQDGTTEIID